MTISTPQNQPAVLIVCKAQSLALEITQHTQAKQQSTNRKAKRAIVKEKINCYDIDL